MRYLLLIGCLFGWSGYGGAATESTPGLEDLLADLHRYRLSDAADSTQLIATILLETAPPGSATAITALYYQSEAILYGYDEAKATAALARLTAAGEGLVGEARELHAFYLHALRGYYHATVSHNYERAGIYYVNALRSDHLDPALSPDLLRRMAGVLSTLGQYPLVERCRDRYLEEQNPSRMSALERIDYRQNLAHFAAYLEDYDGAMVHQQQVLRQLEAQTAALPDKRAAAYLRAGDWQYKIKKNKRCQQYIERAAALRPSYLTTSELIPISYHLGDYASTLDACRRSLTYLLPDFRPTDDLEDPAPDLASINNYQVAYVLRWKARTLYKQALDRKDADALPRLHAALAAAEQARRRYRPYLQAAEGYTMTQYIINRATIYGQGYQLRTAYEIYRRTQQHADLKRFYRFAEMQRNYLISAALTTDHLPPTERVERQARMKALEDLEYHIVEEESDSTVVYERRIVHYSQALDSCITRQQARYPRPVTDQAQLTYADPDVIQASLDERTVFIEYAQQWQHWYAYVITAERQYAVKLAADFQLGDAVALLLHRLKDPLQVQRPRREELIGLSHYVYQQLLGPLEADLAGKERLVIVPERDLCLLPFEVLLADKTPKPYAELDYLLERFEISYHASGTLYEELRARPSVVEASFLGFAPVFTEDNALVSRNRSIDYFPETYFNSIEAGNFVGLPGTEAELTAVAELLPDTAARTLVLHREATTARLVEELQRPYRYVHIATHGMMNFYDPRLSAFATYGPDGEGGDYFFAHETDTLDLRPDLVVLSSCESGVGRIVEGENVVGLSRAFMAAGAKNILYSLWKINDRYSGELVVDFYRAHLAGASYAAALRTAKLRLLADPATAAPRYWAPLVLTGE